MHCKQSELISMLRRQDGEKLRLARYPYKVSGCNCACAPVTTTHAHMARGVHHSCSLLIAMDMDVSIMQAHPTNSNIVIIRTVQRNQNEGQCAKITLFH